MLVVTVGGDKDGRECSKFHLSYSDFCGYHIATVYNTMNFVLMYDRSDSLNRKLLLWIICSHDFMITNVIKSLNYILYTYPSNF